MIFRNDHSKPPILKSYIYMIDDSSVEAELNEGRKDVLGSVFYRHSQPSNDIQKGLFGQKVFPNPKDHDILARLIRYVTNDDGNAIVLDSFAGSGTTAHAVAALNASDGGNRRFILIEMEPAIATEITAERIRRVMQGYTDAKGNQIEGLGGGFRYCRLGTPIFDEAANIQKDVTFAELAAHVYFAETGEPIPKRSNGKSPFLGVNNGNAVYLLYNGILGDKSPDGGNVLTNTVLKALPSHDGPRIIFGEGCRLGAARLKREGIVFRQIPYGIKVC